MKNVYIIILLIITSSINIKAQFHYKEGSVVTHNNDTIHGLIDIGNNKRNALKCKFKTNKNSEAVIYRPEDIKAYWFADGKYYISKQLKPKNPGMIFLEFLIDGIVDIYFYADNLGWHYMIEKEGKGLVELSDEEKEVFINNQTYMVKLNEHKKILKDFFSDSPVFMTKAEDIKLNHNSLIKIAEGYHNEVCSDEQCLIYAKKKGKPEIHFGPLFGFSHSSLSYKYNHQTKLLNEDYFLSKSYFMGAFVSFRDSVLNDRWSFQLEILYSKHKYEKGEASIELSNLQLPILFKYSFPLKKIEPSLIGGFVVNNLLNFQEDITNSERKAIKEGRMQYGGIIGCGIDYKLNSGNNIFLQFRYEYCEGRHGNVLKEWQDESINTDFFKSITSGVNILVGFKF